MDIRLEHWVGRESRSGDRVHWANTKAAIALRFRLVMNSKVMGHFDPGKMGHAKSQ